ncbi:MAG TPA: adenylate/guanylate cyclase domain-containing protein [Blastocatellia bacterium]|nr:adenylate/guanylate cyclase domain-containing protein [Blastocatellia bacterium]
MKDESKKPRPQTADLKPQVPDLKYRKGDSSFIQHPSSGQPVEARELLGSLLSDLNQYPARRDEIERQIREAFERRVAILALDMVGFSRLTIEYGIIHYLAMIHQMAAGAIPAINGNGGRVIKQEADNIFAIFNTPAQALESALDIFRAFNAINSVVPAERDIFGSIGIGYGETLIIGEADLFGSEMNLACKLGEDLAGKSEILLTAAAHAALPARRYVFEPVSFSISDIEIDCYRYERRRSAKPKRR